MPEIAQYLYNQGAKPNIEVVGLDSVQQIVKHDNHKQFIKAAQKDSPLHESSLKHIKALLQNDFNTSGFLFMTESDEITKLLIMHGADVNEKDKNGLTPILYHLRYGHGMTNINLLVEYGADLYVVDELGNAPIDYIAKRKRITPLEVQKQVASGEFTMFTYVKYHKPESINVLLNKSYYDRYSKGLSEKKVFYYMFFNSQDFNERKQIEPKKVKLLYKCETLEEVKEAIRHGESIEKSFHFGMKPLKFFIKLYKDTQDQNYYEIAQYLYDQGAKPNIDSAYLNILLRLVKKENQKHFIEAIIKDSPLYQSPLNNLKVLLQDDFNTSGLLFMTQYDDIGELLLKHGADVNEKDENGLTPILYALKYGYGFSSYINLRG